MLCPTFHSGKPLYEQLYCFLRQEIESGHLPAGEKLPSKRILSAQTKISVVTVETAYSQLVAEGYLRSENRRGFFVCADAERPAESASDSTAAVSDGAAPQPQCTYDFAVNAVDTSEFPFSTWAKLTREVLSRQDTTLLRAAHPQGVPELRNAIVSHLYHFRGIQVSPEQIVVGAGSEYLTCLLVQLLGRKGGWAVEDPGYQKIPQILQRNDVCVYPIPVDLEGLMLDPLRTSGARVVHVTPSHHFPLSIVMPISRRRQLLQWASEQPDRYIIEDDYDSEFRLSGRPIPAMQGMDWDGRVIYLNTFTKSLAPSMRISYMVLPKALAKRYREDFYSYSSTVPSFEQYTLALFMERGHLERHIWRTRHRHKERRDTLVSALSNSTLSAITSISGGDAGLHLLLKVKNGMNEQQLSSSARAHSVCVYPLSSYYRGNIRQDDAPTLLMGLSTMDTAEIKQAVLQLEIAWAAHIH